MDSSPNLRPTVRVPHRPCHQPHMPLYPSQHSSAQQHSPVVDSFLSAQLEQGYLLGPFPPQDCPAVITSSLAVIPKKTFGKWRVIVGLSRPRGHRVNDSLLHQHTHLAYASVEDAAHIMHHLGQGALLAKLDIKDAHRMVPIHPYDRRFLGIQ